MRCGMTCRMIKSGVLSLMLSGVLVLGLAPSPDARAAQDQADASAKKDKGKKDKKDKKNKKDKADKQHDERPVLWRDPGNIESLDLFGGPGGQENSPDPKAR